MLFGASPAWELLISLFITKVKIFFTLVLATQHACVVLSVLSIRVLSVIF